VVGGGGGGADTVCGAGSLEQPAITAKIADIPITPNRRREISEGEALIVSIRRT
jgi:hypothetical protein